MQEVRKIVKISRTPDSHPVVVLQQGEQQRLYVMSSLGAGFAEFWFFKKGQEDRIQAHINDWLSGNPELSIINFNNTLR